MQCFVQMKPIVADGVPFFVAFAHNGALMNLKRKLNLSGLQEQAPFMTVLFQLSQPTTFIWDMANLVVTRRQDAEFEIRYSNKYRLDVVCHIHYQKNCGITRSSFFIIDPFMSSMFAENYSDHFTETCLYINFNFHEMLL